MLGQGRRRWPALIYHRAYYIVASELKDPICHFNECQIGSFSSEPTICLKVSSKHESYQPYRGSMWATVSDAPSALNLHRFNVACLLKK